METAILKEGRRERGREEGFTLLEIAIAAVVVQIGLLGMASSFMAHSRANVETRAADMQKMATRNAIEVLRSSPFETLIADFGPTGANKFWADKDGNISFGSVPAYAPVVGTITLYDDIDYIPTSFADMGKLFAPADPANKLYAELGVLPVRLTITAGTTTTMVDLMLTRGVL